MGRFLTSEVHLQRNKSLLDAHIRARQLVFKLNCANELMGRRFTSGSGGNTSGRWAYANAASAPLCHQLRELCLSLLWSFSRKRRVIRVVGTPSNCLLVCLPLHLSTETLMDSTTATAELGWTVYPVSGSSDNSVSDELLVSLCSSTLLLHGYYHTFKHFYTRQDV